MLDCSDSGKRILVTQVPKIGYALKLPNNDNKKKKIKTFSLSHKEISNLPKYPQLDEAWPQRNESSHSFSTHNSFGLVRHA
jgi:hypothetical protein